MTLERDRLIRRRHALEARARVVAAIAKAEEEWLAASTALETA